MLLRNVIAGLCLASVAGCLSISTDPPAVSVQVSLDAGQAEDVCGACVLPVVDANVQPASDATRESDVALADTGNESDVALADTGSEPDVALADAHEAGPDHVNSVWCYAGGVLYIGCDGKQHTYSISTPDAGCPAGASAFATCNVGDMCSVNAPGVGVVVGTCQ